MNICHAVTSTLFRDQPYRTRTLMSPLDRFIFQDCLLPWLEPGSMGHPLGMDCHCLCVFWLMHPVQYPKPLSQVPVTQTLWTLRIGWLLTPYRASPALLPLLLHQLLLLRSQNTSRKRATFSFEPPSLPSHILLLLSSSITERSSVAVSKITSFPYQDFVKQKRNFIILCFNHCVQQGSPICNVPT